MLQFFARPLQAVAEHAAVEGPATDAQQPGALADIPGGFFQRDQETLFFIGGRRRDRFLPPGRARGGLQGDMLGPDHFPAAEHKGPLNDVFQFAHIARPGMAHEDLHDLRGHPGNGLGILAVEFEAEMLRQQGNVLHPLA